jgi:RHS repeat-associated protein
VKRLSLAIALILATPLFAQQGDTLEKGFAGDKVYDFGGIDSINTFNGNLNVTIPLGAEYPVNGKLAYRLTLSYNSKVWDYEGYGGQMRSLPNRRSNGGMGWMVSLGRLVPPLNATNDVNQWVYESADGNEHIFYDKLHDADSATVITAPVTAVRYTRDGSYLRMLEKTDGTIDVEFPDGGVHNFDTASGLLKIIRDRSSNSVTVTYLTSPVGTPCPSTDTNVWQLTDSKAARTNYVCFKNVSSPESINSGIVDKVIVAAPATSAGAAQNVTYSFTYTLASVMRGCHHQVAGDPLYIDNVPTLTGLTQPDGSSYAFTYFLSDAGTSECWRGSLKSVKLPTAGNVAYTYRNFPIPADQCGRQTFNSRSVGIATKTISGPRIPTGTWTYSSVLSAAPPGQVECDNGSTITLVSPPPEEMTVTVKDPLNHVTEHFYSVWPGVPGFPSPNGFSEYEYGLPLTRKQSSASTMAAGVSAYLSRRIYSAAGYGASPRVPLQSMYVTYERDVTTCGGTGHRCTNVNPRVNRDQIVYHDDGDRKAETARASFDGLGHHRKTTLGGTFPGGTSETYAGHNVRDANVNPTSGINTADYSPGGSFTPPASATPWIINSISSTTVTEGTNKTITQTCYDATTGFLRATRNVNPLALSGSTSDAVTVLRADANGNLASETLFGATDATAYTEPLCTTAARATLPTPNYRVDHTYQWGVRATSRHEGATFYHVDRTIDRYTGVTRSSRDTAGLTTTYSYDSAFRITSIQPPGLSARTFTHSIASGTTASTFVPARVRTSTTATGLGTAQVEYQYDALGRLWREKTYMPDNTWSVRETLFDANGNVTSRSEQEKLAVVTTEYDFNPVRKTIFGSRDALRRPSSTTLPDGKVLTYQYKGASETKRIVPIAGPSGEVATATAETFDRQGRLASVTEAVGTAAALTTTYFYDAADHLTKVEMPGAAGVQTRLFSYDHRGFLTQEQQPELGASGNGSTDYLNYDARGLAGRRKSGTAGGPYDLDIDYDAAGRVTKVSVYGTTQTLKLFAYDDPTGASYPQCVNGRCNGKPAAAARYNYTSDLGTVAITESYQYDATTGLMSRRDTTVGSGTGFTGESFNVGQTYNPFGDVYQTFYPCRSGAGGCNAADPATPTVTYAYTNGELTGVGTWASSITYAPNGTVDTVTHGSGTTAVREKWVGDSGMHRPCGIFVYGPGLTLTADASAPCGQRLTGNGAQWTSGTYAYDGGGNISQIGANTYRYDAFSRLTNWTENGFSSVRAYDAWGNMTATGYAISGTTNHYSSMTYDSAGNVTSDGTRTFAYDSMNMVASATAGGRSFRYLYTPNDERIAAIERINVGGVLRNKTTWTLRGLSNELLRVFVTDATSGTPMTAWKENTFWRNGSLLANENSTGLRHYGLDHLGSPRILTSATGALVGTQTFAAFGAGGTSDGGALQFTGQERDAATLAGGSATLPDYFHARYYDSGTGRFLSLDPVHGNSRLPQSWNAYAYALNNPHRYIDPDGRAIIIWAPRPQPGDGVWQFMAGNTGWFISGAANAFGSNNLFGRGRVHLDGNNAYAWGQLFGDAASMLSGGAEMIGGVGGEIGGLALDLTGIGAAVGIPVQIVSGAVIAHGGVTTAIGTAQLMSGIKRRKDGTLGEFKGTDAKSRENKQVSDAMKAAGYGGDKAKKDRVHEALQHEPKKTFQELVQFIRDMFN